MPDPDLKPGWLAADMQRAAARVAEWKAKPHDLTPDELRSFFRRALLILNEFAGEGITMDGAEDPQDYLMELVERLGVEDWDEVPALLT